MTAKQQQMIGEAFSRNVQGNGFRRRLERWRESLPAPLTTGEREGAWRSFKKLLLTRAAGVRPDGDRDGN